jgi:hypothetical protein
MERNVRNVSEREIAIALLIRMAESEQSGLRGLSLSGLYVCDDYFIDDLAMKIGIENNKAFFNKLKRITRKLVRHNVFLREATITREGTRSKYVFAKPWESRRLYRKETDDASSQEREAKYLLSRAYPEPHHV